MKLPLVILVLAGLVLTTICQAAAPWMANLFQSNPGNLEDDLNENGRLQSAINSANQHYARGTGRLTLAQPWQHQEAVAEQLRGVLLNERSLYVPLGHHGNDLLFGIPYTIQWDNRPGPTDHVLILKVNQNSGVRAVGYANWAHAGSTNDIPAFMADARRRQAAVPLTRILELVGYGWA